MKAEVYSKNGCGYCVAAKNLLKAKEIEILEYNFQLYPEKREELFERAQKENVVPKTAPQIWLDGKYIGGYDQLKAYFDSQQ